jgi:GATA-type transcription activator-like protein
MSKTLPPSAHSMPSADDSDSEGSIVRAPSKAHSSCGACRTRDTKHWWKAPKGLPTPVLCDACGISWRKYADLNHLRPIREEAAAAKQGKAEKREGTPLASSNSKRVKVSVSFLPAPMQGFNMDNWCCRLTGRFRLLHHRLRVMGLRNIAVLRVTSTVLVRSLSAKSAKLESILVSYNQVILTSYLIHVPRVFRRVWDCRPWFNRVLDMRPLPK